MSLKRMFVFVMLFSALAAVTVPAQAAPANPHEVELPQPDGSTVRARAWGDERLHGYETAAGYTIMVDPSSGYWVYAARDLRGGLAPVISGGRPLIAGRDLPRGLAPGLRPDLPAGQNVPGAGHPTTGTTPDGAVTGAASSDGLAPLRAPSTGSQPLLLFYVRFANTPSGDAAAPGNTPGSYFRNLAFGSGSSIASYYAQASFGKLALPPAAESDGPNDGLVEVNLPTNHPNNTNASRDIVRAALTAADPSVNFAAFDTDGNGAITPNELHLLFIIAGYEESYSLNPGPDIWAHQWWLINAPLSLDGKLVAMGSAGGSYFVFGELHGDHPATYGVMVHELGHDLSWPDLYDVDSSSNGVGQWSIMGYGSWNFTNEDGDTPAQPDAFLKYYQGWLTPATAVNGQTYDLRSADGYAEALLLGTNPGGVDWDFEERSGSGEYWLVENRQEDGLPGCGLLVWHIDETRSPWNTDANANEARPLVGLVQADAHGDLFGANYGDSGDPYPGDTGNSAFNFSSVPEQRYYSGAPSSRGLSILSDNCVSSMQVKIVDFDGLRLYLPMLRK